MKSNLETKVLEITKELGLSHVSSNTSVLPILEEIYDKKNPDDKVILDNGHSHLAHLVVATQDYRDLVDPALLIKRWGIHCDRQAGCDASGGSLGHGLGIGIGYALANKDIKVYVIVSDGSMMEGSNWEALRLIRDLKVDNLIIYTNFNGYTALATADFYTLKTRMQQFCGKSIEFRQTTNVKGYSGVSGHYLKV